MRKQNKLKTSKTQESEANVNLLCRLCLNHCDNENSNDIFDSKDFSLTLRIMACAGLEVTQQDSLPKRICLECRLTLEKSFLFRNKCKNSDGKLRHHFRLINAGKESSLFDDLDDDEFEDEYSESIEIINKLEEKLNQKQKDNIESKIQNAIERETQRIYDEAKATLDRNPIKPKRARNSEPEPSTKRPITRSSANQRQRTTDDEKNFSIEVLMEDDAGEDIEYILAESDYNNTDSCDDDQNPFGDSSECDLFELDQLTNADVKDSDEIMGIKDLDGAEYLDDCYDDTSGNDLLLESLLPAIKKSVAQKSGTILDDKAQYKFVRTSGEEIRVQCIASDGKEFEIEMVMDQAQSQTVSYERDESGDFKIFSCSKCPKTFSRRGKLINHERDHSAKTSGQECPHCQKWFPSNSTLTRHIRVHTGEKPFTCSICKRAFIQKEILKRHLMTHSGERPFKCSQCPKSFILKEALRQHINRNHTENPMPEMHKCPFCPKSFCHSSGLSRHLLIHAGRTFACDFCHKKFNDKSALKRHTTSIHNAVGPKIEKN